MGRLLSAYNDVLVVCSRYEYWSKPDEKGGQRLISPAYYYVARYRAVEARDGHMYWKLVEKYGKGSGNHFQMKMRAKRLAKLFGISYLDENIVQYTWCDQDAYMERYLSKSKHI